ncbi:MAG: GNAT family N-acetyltransferase [Thermonemataceae bacterium]
MYTIRPIEPQDNNAVKALIHTVMPEFGAVGSGFAIEDAEVEAMYEAYKAPRHAYFVIAEGQEVFGGAGIAPLVGAEAAICELRKMYLLPSVRGKGYGQQLLTKCLAEAKAFGFEQCYIETLTQMGSAQGLYQKNGFQQITEPLGNTGHHGCDLYFAKEL